MDRPGPHPGGWEQFRVSAVVDCEALRDGILE